MSDDLDAFAELDEAQLRRLDLNLLLVFSAVMRAGSVRAAAHRLHLGPSGVSMALGRLQRMVDRRLFDRAANGLAPTPFARRLFSRVAPALAELNAALASERDFDPAAAERVFRVAFSDDVEMVAAPRLQAALHTAAPRCQLVLRAGDYTRASALLDAGGADLVIAAAPAKLQARHRSLTLYTEDFVALFDPARLGHATLTLETYLAVPHVLISALGVLRGLVDEALAADGLQRSVAVSLEHFSTLPFLLKASPLIANVPRRAARILERQFALRAAELPLRSPTFDVAAVWHSRGEGDRAQAWLRELLFTLLSDIQGSPEP